MNSFSAPIESSLSRGPETEVLPSIVGFSFAFRSFIMVLSVRLLGVDPRIGTALSLSVDYLLLLMVAFSTFGETSRPLKSILLLKPVRWALVYLGFSCCSLLWSSTASLPDSIAYWCGMAADAAIVIALSRARPAGRVSRLLMTGYVWGACAVAAIAWIMPAQSDLRLGDEELLGANQIGYICGFAFFLAQCLKREWKCRLFLPSTLLALTLLRSLSKTTIVAFLVGQGFLLVFDTSMSRKTKAMMTLAAATVVAAFWGLLANYYDIYSNAESQASTLTGRLGIWAYLLAEAIQQPWIGHGFDSVWKVVPPFGSDQFEAAHAHNELLQQFYAYGLVGIAMFAGIYISFFRYIRSLANGPLRTFCFALMLFVLVRGGADTERFDLSLPIWAVIMFSILIENANARQTDSSPAGMIPAHSAVLWAESSIRPGAGLPEELDSPS